ncbi:MAG: hypothetical protein V4612_04340 [Pseudomonadota bacterium]
MTTKLTRYLFLLLFLFSHQAFADARKSTFRNSQKLSQYLAIGGNYSSDQNSKEYKISGSYQYNGSRFINELDLLHHTRYTSSTTHALEKNRELYDGEISTKILISKSSNYFNYYNRSKYDEFSDYYYDITNAIGWGRMFFGGILEADMNIGYDEIKNFDSQIVLNPNLKANLWLTDKLKLTVKAFIFQVQDSYSEELKTRLSYKMTNDLSLELYHNYDKKRFFNKTAKTQTTKTEVSRDLVVRIRYDF